MPEPLRLVLTCEHGGNRVPPEYRGLFRGAASVLVTHRGFDAGALTAARFLAARLRAPLLSATTTRLLVDLNRSPHNPAVFSRFTRDLPAAERQRLLARHHRPHRDRVRVRLVEELESPGRVLHLAVHSFTPVLHGRPRRFDVGLLYDPQRTREASFCRAWQRHLREVAPDLRVRRNAPYRGSSDGLTTALRREFGPRYLGIELEINQRHVQAPAWQPLLRVLHLTFSHIHTSC